MGKTVDDADAVDAGADGNREQENDGTEGTWNARAVPGTPTRASWTRYLELTPDTRVTLADLGDEDRYPCRLNCIRVDATRERLRPELICFEAGGGSW